MDKVSVVIASYNRLELLKECIKCIENQVYYVDNIIIVNNASTDGTNEYLLSVKENNRFIVYNEMINTGGSGAFYRGMKIADELQNDWIVLIDDDAMLRSTYISDLIKGSKIHSNCLAFTGNVLLNGKIDISHRRSEVEIDIENYRNKYFEFDYASFCGLMINKKIIKQIGFPEKDFFIWFDDTEYSMRLRKVTKIINITTACLDHKTVVPLNANYVPSWKSYYGVRNKIYSFEKHNLTEKLTKELRLQNKMKKRYVYHFIKKEITWKQMKFSIILINDAIHDARSNSLGINKKYYPGKKY